MALTKAERRERSKLGMRKLRVRRKAEAAEARKRGWQVSAAPRCKPGHEVSACWSWAEERLRVPTGPLRSQPFRVEPGQREFLQAVMAPAIRDAGLSVARKKGKSGLIAALLLGYLMGPLRHPQWRGVVVSLTGRLAVELRDAIQLTAEASEIPLTVKRAPYPGCILGADGTRLDILAVDKATGHAIGADLAVIDEAGLLQENQRALWDAVFSPISGRDGRLLCISIRSDGPMFGEFALRSDDPAVVWTEFAADPQAPIDDPAQWKAANPGLGGIKSESYMSDAVRRALSNSNSLSTFRAYNLNLPQVPTREMICGVEDWTACVTDQLPERDGNCVVGFDLDGSSSMTAAAEPVLLLLATRGLGLSPTEQEACHLKDHRQRLRTRLQKASSPIALVLRERVGGHPIRSDEL